MELYGFLTEEHHLFVGEGKLKCSYRFCKEDEMQFFKNASPVAQTNSIRRYIDRVFEIMQDPWAPGKLRMQIGAMLGRTEHDFSKPIEPKDYWLVARLARYVRALRMTKRDDVAYLTKGISPRSIEIPRHLLTHSDSFQDAIDAVKKFQSGGELDTVEFRAINEAKAFLLLFWEFIAEQYLQGEVIFYETVQDIYEMVSIKVPLVVAPGIR